MMLCYNEFWCHYIKGTDAAIKTTKWNLDLKDSYFLCEILILCLDIIVQKKNNNKIWTIVMEQGTSCQSNWDILPSSQIIKKNGADLPLPWNLYDEKWNCSSIRLLEFSPMLFRCYWQGRPENQMYSFKLDPWHLTYTAGKIHFVKPKNITNIVIGILLTWTT